MVVSEVDADLAIFFIAFYGFVKMMNSFFPYSWWVVRVYYTHLYASMHDCITRTHSLKAPSSIAIYQSTP